MHLATFVHISDLHFGDINPTTGENTYDAMAPKIWANNSQFDGLLGHRYIALKRLAEFFHSKHRDEGAQLIVTGDLTCVGKDEQFDTANEYLGALLQPPKGRCLGLAVGDWKDRAVPGNHDHWPGMSWMFGGPTPALGTHFPHLPFISPPIALSTGQQLRFVGINTDADVWPYGRDRLLARGVFHNQLHLAAGHMANLGLPCRNEICVLLLHHSHEWPGATLRMTTASRQALNTFIAEQSIAVLLCGHTHVPYVGSNSVTHQGSTIEFLEARCGSTTQWDIIPYNWKTLWGTRPKRNLQANTLIVHRLREENREIKWRAETYQRKPHGFEKATGPNLEDELTVWSPP